MFKNMGENIPGGSFLGGNFQEGSLMGGNFLGGSFQEGSLMCGNFLGGSFPDTVEKHGCE